MSSHSKLPRFEPEVLRAKERYYHGDFDKVSTTAIKELRVHGITITSRYGKAEELELMREVISSLDRGTRDRIKSVFCDSKRGASYSLTMDVWAEYDATRIAEEVSTLFLRFDGGHNGVRIGSGENFVDAGADWTGEHPE